MQRLLGRRARLNALLSTSEASNDGTTWYAMAQATLYQLDCDIESLFEWLRDYKPDTPIRRQPVRSTAWAPSLRGRDSLPGFSLQRQAQPAISSQRRRTRPTGRRTHTKVCLMVFLCHHLQKHLEVCAAALLHKSKKVDMTPTPDAATPQQAPPPLWGTQVA